MESSVSLQDPSMQIPYSRLKLYIKETRQRHHQALAVVVAEKSVNLQAAEKVAFRLELPFVLKNNEVNYEIFGMSPGELIVNLQDFWNDEQKLRQPTNMQKVSQQTAEERNIACPNNFDSI
jgi:hypothetical protein